jgi:hypothetical protein
MEHAEQEIRSRRIGTRLPAITGKWLETIAFHPIQYPSLFHRSFK